MESNLEKMLINEAVAQKKAFIMFKIDTVYGMFDNELEDDLLFVKQVYEELKTKSMDLNYTIINDCNCRVNTKFVYGGKRNNKFQWAKDLGVVEFNGSRIYTKYGNLVAFFEPNNIVEINYNDGTDVCRFRKKVNDCSLAELTLIDYAMVNLLTAKASMGAYIDSVKELMFEK